MSCFGINGCCSSKSISGEKFKERGKAFLKYAARFFAVFLTVLLLLVLAALSAIFVLVRGPSPIARRYFVLTVKETSAVGFLADIFLTESEVSEIMEAQIYASDKSNQQTTNSSLINIPTKGDTSSGSDDDEIESPDPMREIEIIEIRENVFNGVLMIIDDPSRIFLGKPDEYGYDCSGISLRSMIARSGAIGGINGGGFYDPSGSGNGGIPDGIVIDDGKIVWGELNVVYNLIGFDKSGVLHVGNMTGRDALDADIMYACSFGPTLIVNGIPCNNMGDLGGGLNPRTAIGQRDDGAVLFLVINGRSIGSLGATYDDLIDVLLSYGAVNASNLDGGSSSLMMLNGEFLNESASVIGERTISTAFLIRP